MVDIIANNESRVIVSELLASVKRSLAKEFFGFLTIYGILGLAIAFVIGQAASKLITAFVNDIITPFIGLSLPAGDLSKMGSYGRPI